MFPSPVLQRLCVAKKDIHVVVKFCIDHEYSLCPADFQLMLYSQMNCIFLSFFFALSLSLSNCSFEVVQIIHEKLLDVTGKIRYVFGQFVV